MGWFKNFAAAMVKERAVPLKKMGNIEADLRNSLQDFAEDNKGEISILSQVIQAGSEKGRFVGRIEKDVVNEAAQLAAFAKVENYSKRIDGAMKQGMVITQSFRELVKKDVKRTRQDMDFLLQNLLVLREYAANIGLFSPAMSYTG